MTVLKLRSQSTVLADESAEIHEVKEVLKLESELLKSKADLRLLSVELRQIEKDITKVLDEYYATIGKAESKNHIDLQKRPANINSHNTLVKTQIENDSLKDIISKLYKKISKICYPNIQGNDSISGFFTNFFDEDSKKNIQELIRIEEYLSGDTDEDNKSPKERIDVISSLYEEILIRIREIKNSALSISESAEQELKRQVAWTKICGQELSNKIKNELYKQIQSSTS